MDEIIHSGTYALGDTILITNPNPVSATYRADFGAAGAVRVTLIPGGEFQVTVGTHGPQIYLEGTSSPGLQSA
jgi:hypothetical protein